MKKQILQTLFGLAIISLGVGAAMIGVTVAQFLRENYVFDGIMFLEICAGILILVASNFLGKKVLK